MTEALTVSDNASLAKRTEIALENIVKCPGNFQGTGSQECLVWTQHPHLQGHGGPGSVTTRVGGLVLSAGTLASGRTASRGGSLCLSAALLTTQRSASAAPSLPGFTPTDRSDPMSPSPASPTMSCSCHPAHWPLLPGQCLSERSGHFSPSQNPPVPQVENKCRGRKGETDP